LLSHQLVYQDLVIVVGDVTSTMACAIVAKKLNIKVAHIEGGIRSSCGKDDLLPQIKT